MGVDQAIALSRVSGSQTPTSRVLRTPTPVLCFPCGDAGVQVLLDQIPPPADAVEQLKQFIPRKQFKIPIQASIGSRVIASTSISAIRKDVLAKCYGGDISRKKKLAKGKKRIKAMAKPRWMCLMRPSWLF